MGAFQSPLPVPQGERLMGIRYRSLETGQEGSSVHDYARWQELGLASFEQLTAARSYKMSVHDGEPGAPQVSGAEMTPSAFGLLGATPLLAGCSGPRTRSPAPRTSCSSAKPCGGPASGPTPGSSAGR